MFLYSQYENRAKKYIAFLLKICVFSAVLFMLAMSIKIGVLNGIITGGLFSVIVTILIAVVLLPIDYIKTKQFPVIALKVHQVRDIELKGNIDSIYSNCINAVKNIKGAIDLVKTVANNINATTKITFFSLGEEISIKLTQNNHESINVHIESQPIFKYTMLDYGKNFKNVECIIKQICKNNVKNN